MPIQSGCACRGVAEHHVLGEWNEAWHTCLMCKQRYTGAMELGLALAAVQRFNGKPAADQHRLCAEGSLAGLYVDHGRYTEAEPLLRENLATRRCTFGNDHPGTLTVSQNLGNVFNRQRKNGAAEAVFRDVLERWQRFLGPTLN